MTISDTAATRELRMTQTERLLRPAIDAQKANPEARAELRPSSLRVVEYGRVLQDLELGASYVAV